VADRRRAEYEALLREELAKLGITGGTFEQEAYSRWFYYRNPRYGGGQYTILSYSKLDRNPHNPADFIQVLHSRAAWVVFIRSMKMLDVQLNELSEESGAEPCYGLRGPCLTEMQRAHRCFSLLRRVGQPNCWLRTVLFAGTPSRAFFLLSEIFMQRRP